MVAIDGVHLKKDLGIDIMLEIELPILPPTRDRTLQLPHKHGAYDFDSYMDPVPHAIPVRINDKNMIEIQRRATELKRLLLDDWGKAKNVKLTYDLEPNKYHIVKYSGSLDIERRAMMGGFTLPFINNKAWHFSVVESHEIHWDSEIVTMDDDYAWGTTAINEIKVNAPITLETYVNGLAVRPSLTIKGTGENVTFRCNGKSFSLKDFTNSEFVINGQNYTVLKDGLNGFSEKVGKDFLELLPGMNQIEITGDNMDITLTLRYRDQYM